MKAPSGEYSATSSEGLRKSLRAQVGLLVGGAMLLLLLALMIISSMMIDHFFAGLQDRLTGNKALRVALGMNQIGRATARLVKDNAEWDEAYDFVAGRNPDFLQRNYAPKANSSGQDIVMVFDANRRLVGAIRTKDGTFAPPEGIDMQALSRSKLLAASDTAGLEVDGSEVLLLTACPIFRSGREGISNGWLVFGTYFTQARITELAQTSGTGSIRISPAGTVNLPDRVVGVTVDQPYFGKGMAYFMPTRYWRGDGASPNVFLFIDSVAGGKGVTLVLSLSLVVYQQAIEAKNWIIGASVLCGLMAVVAGLAALERSVLRPLADLDQQMSGMLKTEGEVGLLKVSRDEEIGRLAQSANGLLQRALTGKRVAEAQKALIDGILDSASEGVMALRPVRDAENAICDFDMVVINRSAGKICRMDVPKVLGKGMIATFPRVKSAGIFHRLVRVVESGYPDDYELFYEGHNFSAWLHFSAAPWEDGVVVTFEDVTERKNRERALSESFVEIERFNAAMIGREERIIEMKREVNELRGQLGMSLRYEVSANES